MRTDRIIPAEVRSAAEQYATFRPAVATHGAIALRELARAVLALGDMEHVGWQSHAKGFLHDDGTHGLVCADGDCDPIYRPTP